MTPAQPVVYVPPSQYKIAQLQCNIRGFPDNINWLKDGIPIVETHPDSTRYMWRREVQEDQGIIEAHLDISAVSVMDYGTYTCKVNNTFGSHDASIVLAGKLIIGRMPYIQQLFVFCFSISGKSIKFSQNYNTEQG